MQINRDEVLEVMAHLLEVEAGVENLARDAANALTKKGEAPGAHRMVTKAMRVGGHLATIRQLLRVWQAEAELDERRGDNRKSAEALREKGLAYLRLADEREAVEKQKTAQRVNTGGQ